MDVEQSKSSANSGGNSSKHEANGALNQELDFSPGSDGEDLSAASGGATNVAAAPNTAGSLNAAGAANVSGAAKAAGSGGAASNSDGNCEEKKSAGVATGAQGIDEDDDDLPDHQPPVERKLPPWAIWVAVIAFVVFNAFFLCFAMQMGSGTPSD